MERGKISAALRCIGSLQCGVHEITPDVLRVLQEKHPEGSEAVSGSVLQGPLPEKLVEEVVYENLNGRAIFKAAKKVNGAAGPSGADLICGRNFFAQNNIRKSQLGYAKPWQILQKS